MERERVKEGDIIVGEPTPWNAFDQEGILLLRKGQTIESESQLEILIKRGLFHIILDKEDDRDDEPIIKAQSPFELIDTVQNRLEHLFNNLVAGVSNKFPVRILELSRLIQQAIDIDDDAALGIIFMHGKCRYTIVHPIHVAIFCEVLTRDMKWSENDRLVLMAAALTQNVSIIELQERLYDQKTPLTEEQRKMIIEHPEHSVEILSQAGVTNRAWIDVVLNHHELLDGSGYPAGLKGYAIPKSARLITIGDIYCAAVSEGTYRASSSPDEAMKEIYLSGGNHVDTDLINRCVKLIGIYPPGIFIRLANGEIAVVTHRGEKAHLPVVHSVARANGKVFLEPRKRDCSKDEYAIKEVITDEQDKITVNRCQLWGHGSLLPSG